MSEPSQFNDEAKNSSGLPAATKGSEGGRFGFWVAALAIVLAIFFHDSLFGGKGLVSAGGIFNFPPWMEGTNRPTGSLFSDQYLVFIPQHEYMHREFLQGKFPLWNPNLDCGQPNVASIQSALLFPINLLLLPIDPFYAGEIAAFLKLFLAGLFTMLYLRLLGANNSGAFLSGLVFSLSGFMVCWLGHPHVNCAMCLPLLLYLIEKTFQYGTGQAPGILSRPALRNWAWLGIAFGCLLLGGHPPTMVQVIIFAGICFLFRLIGQWKHESLPRVGLIICAGILGILLAAPALLPFFEYYQHSAIDASSAVMDRTANRMPLNTLILYLFPHLSGSPREGYEETMLSLGIGNLLPNFLERTGYVGVLPLLFAFCALFIRRCRSVVFYGLTALICMLAVYGMPPFPTLFGALPVIRDINPTRLVMIAGFSIAVLAGLGWDSFYRLENRHKKIWIVAGFWAVIGLVLLWYWHQVAPRLKHLDADHRSFLEPQLFFLLGSFATSAALLLPSVSRQWKLCSLIGLGWIAVDLLIFGMGINPTVSHDAYYPSAPAIDWLHQDKTNFRILGKDMVLTPNTAELYGLKDARGYDFTTVLRYQELIEGQASNFFFYRSAPLLPKAFPMLAVKYVLTFNSPAPDPALFDFVYSNQISIYRNREFHGRVLAVSDYLVQDPATILTQARSGTFHPEKKLLIEEYPTNNILRMQTSPISSNSSAQIVSEEPDEVTVEASMSQPGFVLLLDTYFPGWKATVNGQSTPILRADYNFRAVPVPAGKSVVRFVYLPESWRIGIGLFLIGAALTVLAIFWPEKKKINTPA